MISRDDETTAVLFSGGVDSTVLLGWLLEGGHRVQPIYVRAGLYWETAEEPAARQVLHEMRSRYGRRLARLKVLELPVRDVYGEHWSTTGRGVPDDATSDEAVYLPGRNPLLLLKACLWCAAADIRRLAIGTLSRNPFRDATPAFFDTFEQMFVEATGTRIEILRPFAKLSKRELLALGHLLPLEATFSCLAPEDGLQCGKCNKCAERSQVLELVGAGWDGGTVGP
jgi:7-cyano-7-deazaguanine synthase